MTARNYCPAGECDHLTREAKRKEHGTPAEFAAAVGRNVAQGFMTAEEAHATIARYRSEYDASAETQS